MSVSREFPSDSATLSRLSGMDLEIAPGEFVTLLGPSGCGKTTTLRILGGFEFPDTGRVILEGKDVTRLPPKPAQRKHGFPGLCPLSAHDGAAEHGVRPRTQGHGATCHRTAAGRADDFSRVERIRRPLPPDSSPAGSASGLLSRAHSPPTPRCCCWTNPSARSMQSCAARCNRNSSRSSAALTRRSSS